MRKTILHSLLTAVLLLLTVSVSARQYDGTEKLYFNMNAVSWWSATGNFAYFFNSSSNAWSAKAEQVSGNVYAVTVPAGDWTTVILTRNSVTTNPSWSNKWNQTNDITIDGTKNYISSFSENSATATWEDYSVSPPCLAIHSNILSNSWSSVDMTKSDDDKTALCTITITATSTGKEFGIKKLKSCGSTEQDEWWNTANNTTITESNCTNIPFGKDKGSNAKIDLTVVGDYVFTWNYEPQHCQ